MCRGIELDPLYVDKAVADEGLMVVSDCRSLRGDIVFRPVLVRQSPAAKIPFQTRTGQVDRKGARVSGRRHRMVGGRRRSKGVGQNRTRTVLAQHGGTRF